MSNIGKQKKFSAWTIMVVRRLSQQKTSTQHMEKKGAAKVLQPQLSKGKPDKADSNG